MITRMAVALAAIVLAGVLVAVAATSHDVTSPLEWSAIVVGALVTAVFGTTLAWQALIHGRRPYDRGRRP